MSMPSSLINIFEIPTGNFKYLNNVYYIMKLEIFVIILIALAYLPMNSSQPPSSGEIIMKSDLQMLEFGDIYGGHITWVIKGDIAKELREAIGSFYHVKNIDLSRASEYFVNRLEHVVENNEYGCGYLSFVRLYRSDPLHGKSNGILNNPDDVSGLIGNVNSTSSITIRMLIRGEAEDGKNMNLISHNLFFAPFYAIVNNESEFNKTFNFKNVELKSEHYEIIAGFGSIENIPYGNLYLRLIVGEFFITNSKDSSVRYVKFDPLESPLLLFILFILAWYSFRVIERNLGERYGATAGPINRKRGKITINSERIALFLLYLFNVFNGWIYIVILVASVVITYFFLQKYYSAR